MKVYSRLFFIIFYYWWGGTESLGIYSSRNLAGGTEVLGENLPQRPQNLTWQTRSRTQNRSGGKLATNRLSYGAALILIYIT
jgi:hypothetical protein